MAIKTMQAVINGQTYTLTQESSTGDWVASVVAPSASSFPKDGHYYPVKITATDNAGNSTTVDNTHAALGTSCRLTVKEKTAPAITILSPTTGAHLGSSTPTINFQITDNDSGVDLSSVVIKVDGTALTDVTSAAASGGYTFEAHVTNALDDGPHTITIDAADNDGNAATQLSISITTDTVPPVLNISTPTDGTFTNTAPCVVAGTTNDVTSSPVTLTVNGENITVNTDGSFSTTVILTEGENTIHIIATDAAGKQSAVSRTVTLDTSAPVIQTITITPNPVDAGATYVIRVKASDD